MSEPPVTIAAYHLTPGSNLPVTRIVVHTTSPPGVPYPIATARGKARQTALYFTLASSGGSAHYIVDTWAEEHCLRDDQIAWHAPPNRHSIGIEICGQAYYTRAQWLSGDVWPAVERAKVRALELSRRHGIPWARLTVPQLRQGHRGVCGHVDVSKAFGQTNHTDPGPNFPWDRFMAPSADPPAGQCWEYQEAEVRTTLVLVGPLDTPKGRGYQDWNPGLGRDPVIVGVAKQGPGVDPGDPDPYWEKQGVYDVKVSPRGGVARVVIIGGVPGSTVGVYVSVA